VGVRTFLSTYKGFSLPHTPSCCLYLDIAALLINGEVRLMDICSGFNRDDQWGFRACEPTRNIISSMALVHLKTGIIHPQNPSDGPPYIDQAQMTTAQKLLLFWRKPAVSAFFSPLPVNLVVYVLVLIDLNSV
jgi:hypothetical protein